jgi:hypothetical protein
MSNDARVFGEAGSPVTVVASPGRRATAGRPLAGLDCGEGRNGLDLLPTGFTLSRASD